LKKKFLKGAFSDPFFYFGLISFFFFLIFPLILNIFLKKFEEFNFLKIESFSHQTSLFLGSKKTLLDFPQFSFIQKNSLIAKSPPGNVNPQVLGVILENPERPKEIIEYVIKPGDNLGKIAQKFNISLETLLWANNLNKNSLIKEGEKLIILPVSGVLHHVKEGETLSEIAKIYQGNVKEIIEFNELSTEGDIYVGDILIIPNGVMPKKKVSPPSWPLAKSYFICPITSPCRITFGLHWYNAVDLSHGKCGEPIYAVASGKVLKVKLTNSSSPWALGGAGNHLTILHPNGVVTFYGHLSAILVKPGQEVSQGQIIGLMGGKPGTPGAGRSTGCHLHFGVRGAKNPFAR
jgi:LysM repeat protein